MENKTCSKCIVLMYPLYTYFCSTLYFTLFIYNYIYQMIKCWNSFLNSYTPSILRSLCAWSTFFDFIKNTKSNFSFFMILFSSNQKLKLNLKKILKLSECILKFLRKKKSVISFYLITMENQSPTIEILKTV